MLLAGCASSSKKDAPSSHVDEDVSPVISEYISDYTPFMSKKLPVMKIDSDSGKNDFVTRPVDMDVSRAKMMWGGYKGEPEPWYENCSITVIDENDVISLDKAFAQVRVRGNWTSDYPKKGLRIKFDKKQEMLGLNGGVKMKDWILLASYKDFSFLRDATSYYMSHLISPYYTTDIRPIELYINDTYWGVYLIAERQEIDKHRINLTKNPKDYTGNDIGYLLEIDDHAHKGETGFNISFGSKLKDFEDKDVKTFTSKYTVKNDINSQSQLDFISNYMNNLWKLCYEAVYNKNYYTFNSDYTKLVPSNAKTCYECVSSVVDLESLVTTYILHEIVCDPDFYLTSFYLDVDFGENGNKKLTFEAPWDFDSALGNKKFCLDSQGLYAAVNAFDVDHKEKGVGNPWFLIFINCNWFQDMVKQKWTQIHNQNVIGKLTEYMQFVSTQYKTNFEKNYKIWDNCGNAQRFGWELSSSSLACKNQKYAAEYLEYWLVKRFDALDELWLDN